MPDSTPIKKKHRADYTHLLEVYVSLRFFARSRSANDRCAHVARSEHPHPALALDDDRRRAVGHLQHALDAGLDSNAVQVGGPTSSVSASRCAIASTGRDAGVSGVAAGLLNAKYLDDVSRVYRHMWRDGVVRPEMNPGVAGSERKK